MKKLMLIIFLVVGIAATGSTQEAAKKDAPADTKLKKELTGKVSKLFKKHCSVAGCHRGAYPKKKLNLEDDKFEAATINVTSQQVDSLKLVDTSHPEKSYLLLKVKGGKGMMGDVMPEEAPPLKQEEIELLENWISEVSKHEAKKEEISGEAKKIKRIKKDK